MIICHRINRSNELSLIPARFGVEVDVRHDNRTDRLYLSHDPGSGQDLEEYLSAFRHRHIIFNIKEAGIERRCIELAEKFRISRDDYFLLDVEFPYVYRACGYADRDAIRANRSRRDQFVHSIAVRFSEAEPIEQAIRLQGLVDWLWMDTNTVLPYSPDLASTFRLFRVCLVCPERWGRPQDIPLYARILRDANVPLDAVMTNIAHAEQWERIGYFTV
ncbi:MAG TPA: hypothetical protein PKE31_15680 [Pseudomonadota bacterium]|jgi:hypothetical protein|nr:hypothetical protein [Pseudomonadota bacterium]